MVHRQHSLGNRNWTLTFFQLLSLIATAIFVAIQFNYLSFLTRQNQNNNNIIDYPAAADIRVLGKGTAPALDVDTIFCPRSSVINKVNNNTPPSKLMPIDKVLSIINYWHEINCPQKETCDFSSIGQHLLHIAMKRNQWSHGWAFKRSIVWDVCGNKGEELCSSQV